jgi:hypothetical protein
VQAESTRLYATLIDRLSDVPGVVACAAFEQDGQCLACYVGPQFEALGAGHVIPTLKELASPSDPTMPFEEGVTFVERKLVRVLLRRTPTSTFVVVVEPEGDVDLVVAHLARALDLVARAARGLGSRPPVMSSTVMPPPMHPNRTSSGFYAKTSGEDGANERPSTAPGVRVVDDETVKKLEELSLANLGFASDVVWERIKASVANHAGQIPRGKWLELVGRLASEIEEDDDREAFVAAAMSLNARTIQSDALDLLSPLARYVVERNKKTSAG